MIRQHLLTDHNRRLTGRESVQYRDCKQELSLLDLQPIPDSWREHPREWIVRNLRQLFFEFIREIKYLLLTVFFA